ncbi:MAG: PAS domain S-box protein [Proteobacteria bacterium]|nr:PAS domain S-box protein [Pseudomonadota bacterium]
MLKQLNRFRHSLVLKLIVSVGLTLLVSISVWAYFNIRSQRTKVMENFVAGTNRLGATIKLGTHYSMMLNSRDEINEIIKNISKLKEIENIRIYNKEGKIKFSNRPAELDLATNIKAEACDICHRSEPPLDKLDLSERTRILYSPKGHRMLGIIDPIYNEPGCSAGGCHIHPRDKKILGALDVVISLEETDRAIFSIEKEMIILALFVFFITSTIIFFFVLKFVNEPIRKLIAGTRRIAGGNYYGKVEIDQDDEMGQLAKAVNSMGQKIGEKQADLNAQRDEYQTLFEHVPCLITVQDRNFRLLRYNYDFAKNFNPQPGDFCFHAYKGRSEKCPVCPVEKTFEDGLSHYGEESGIDKDGILTHWLFTTSPIRNEKGEIVAAMEISLNITERKRLEEELKKSEIKYHAIFNNIPNPVFVLKKDTLVILDCNDSVKGIYGFDKDEIINSPFLGLFMEKERASVEAEIRNSPVINQVKQLHKNGDTIFVNIRISPSAYPGEKVLLVTTSDITERLEAEQLLIQASKMTTLGEMASGVAHELNQPLSVIKTASSFIIRKTNQNEKIEDQIMSTMVNKIDSSVDRASKIINHMRLFARKSDMEREKVNVNEILENAFEIFSQQLKIRDIEVVWDTEDNLSEIKADSSRLEQVFINLLINARDAIEDLYPPGQDTKGDKKITLRTRSAGGTVIVEVCDTGIGIPDTILDKIFEPFFTTKEVGKGTGLGLSISYGIIKDCGGSITAESEPGKGACFIMQFPVAAE